MFDDLVAPALRASDPVSASPRPVLGAERFSALRGEDRRARQAADVRRALAAETRMWVADVDAVPRGVATASLSAGAKLGEIIPVAVDPGHRRRGLAVERCSKTI